MTRCRNMFSDYILIFFINSFHFLDVKCILISQGLKKLLLVDPNENQSAIILNL